jgi:hypothetical protein
MRSTLLALLLCALLPAAASAQALAPTAGTRAATAITSDSATVHATINPNGQPTSYRFEYGTTTQYGLQTADQSAGDGVDPVDVTADLTGLSDDTVYHYRVIAWPDSDPTATVIGGDRSFRTLALPGVHTGPAHDVRSDGATLTAQVDPNRSATTWSFQWGLTTAYGQTTPAGSAGKGTTAVPVSSPISGLQPDTTYHFRIVAVSAAGTKLGGDRAFRTFLGPTGVTLAVPIRHVRYGRTTSIDGVVQGTGITGLRVGLEAEPFPFVAPFAPFGDSVPIRRDGSFHLVSGPLQISSRLRVVTRTNPPVASQPITAFAGLIVGASKQPLAGNRYRIQGSVTPHVRGAKVSIQRRKGARWTSVHRTKTSSLGRGRVGYRFVVSQWRKPQHFRVVVRPRTAAYAHGTSRTLTVPAVRRRH